MSQFNINAKYPVFFALILIGLTNLWYYSTEVADIDFTPKTPLGFISAQDGEAFIQQAGQKYWQNTVVGQALFPGERIRTRKNQLALSLASGSNLTLFEESSVELNSFQNDTDLRVRKGHLSLRSAHPQKVKLSLNTQSYLIFNKGEVEIMASPGQFEIQVLSGSLFAKSSGDRRNIQAGQRARLTDHQIFIEESSLELAEPSQLESYPLSANQVFEFRLQSFGPEYDQVFFNYGPTAHQLRKVTLPRDSRNEVYQVRLAPGLWFWKISATPKNRNSKPIETALFKTHFRKLSAPVALNPHRIFYKQGPFNETEVRFEFERPESFKDLVLEISPDPNFYSDVQRVDVGSEISHLAKVGNSGNFFWRVVGSANKGDQIVESQIRQFAILEHIPQDLSWAKQLGFEVDWEVSLETRKNKAKTQELKSGYFSFDLSKIPSDTNKARYRFIKAGTDFVKAPWKQSSPQDLRIPVSESGFYHFQIIADDSSSEKTRLVRSDLLFLSVLGRKPASY